MSLMVIMDQFSGLSISTRQSQTAVFALLIILAIADIIANHIHYKETGIKRQESWRFVLLFEMYILSLVVVLDQFGGASHIGFHPGSGMFWIAMGTAITSTFFTYRRNQKAAAQ
ncbi:hypothetical protein [Salinicoccus cyprini]|uniref:hypothetical protein n=1 Tax=Salinicoccus cyprini TaxID=2493691 RepID=UPI00164373DD|nr:hypothetical protein [Salinicoccus cyprini]